jgi:hypothetical protein
MTIQKQNLHNAINKLIELKKLLKIVGLEKECLRSVNSIDSIISKHILENFYNL